MAQHTEGIFPSREEAEQAIQQLKTAGFDPHHMGLIMRDQGEANALAHEQGLRSTAGAATGSVLGGGAGTLLAATGTLVIPGIGPFIAGGILATALAGGAIGWLAGGLVALGIPHERATYYQHLVEEGWVLLTVDAGHRGGEAREIMRRAGAQAHPDQDVAVEPKSGKMASEPLENPPTSTDDVDRRELLAGSRVGELRGDDMVQGDFFEPERKTRVGNDAVTDAPPEAFPDNEIRQRLRQGAEADAALRGVDHPLGGGPEDIQTRRPLL
jgi:hypothetical protein